MSVGSILIGFAGGFAFCWFITGKPSILGGKKKTTNLDERLAKLEKLKTLRELELEATRGNNDNRREHSNKERKEENLEGNK